MAESSPVLETRGLTVRAGRQTILEDVALEVPEGRVTGVIGPSGAGKSTLLRTLDRLVDLTPSLEVRGTVLYRGRDVRDRDVDVDDLRRSIGIVFQRPVTFPGSISRNVVFAARRLGLVSRRGAAELAERCLVAAGLWEDVKDRLREDASTLSVGQQQRLAIARTLAGDPDVLLMDEPTSSLDPRTTEAIEETIRRLRGTKTLVVVTHDLVQARRISDWVACICPVDGRARRDELLRALLLLSRAGGDAALPRRARRGLLRGRASSGAKSAHGPATQRAPRGEGGRWGRQVVLAHRARAHRDGRWPVDGGSRHSHGRLEGRGDRPSATSCPSPSKTSTISSPSSRRGPNGAPRCATSCSATSSSCFPNGSRSSSGDPRNAP